MSFWARTRRRFANIFINDDEAGKQYMFDAGRQQAIKLFSENLVDFGRDTAINILVDAHNKIRIGDSYDAGFDHAISQLRGGTSL